MNNKSQQPSTSGLNNGSSNSQREELNRNVDITANARFNCSRCQRHSLIPNKPVYYLPCLHILCHDCFERLKEGHHHANNLSVCCPACKRVTTRECIFDDFTYEQARKRCENSDCENKLEDAVFSWCRTCSRYLCEPCATKHESFHSLKDASTYIPLSSRCSTQHTPNRFAAFVCSCRRYLCVNCAQTHRCEKTILTNVSSLIQQSVGFMSKVANNDRLIFQQYLKTYESIQNRRRQIIAEFHNARSSLAHSVTKSTSLLIHRFNDIREHLSILQQSILTQLSAHERMIGMEMQRLKDVIGLESQIKTTKEHNAIPFFSFVKAASSIAMSSCKHQNYNVDQQIPMLNIRVDAKLTELCNFLINFGSVQVNNSLTKPKSKFDNSMMPMFDAVPKINAANNSKSFGYSLRTLNGKKHVVVDTEEIKRSIKRLQDPDELRERCEQLENELAYYKALSNHLESELQNKRIQEAPSTSKTQQSNSQPHPSSSSSSSTQNHHHSGSRQHLSAQQQQILQQLKTTGMQANVQRVPNSHKRPHAMPGFPDHLSTFMHGNPRMCRFGGPPPQNMAFPGHNMQNSLPGSPQYSHQSRHPSTSAQSPLTPNPMIPPNMMFARPPHINHQEWQMHCLQQFRHRTPNPQQLNNCLNELMRNSMAQLSPTGPCQFNQHRMHTPPSQPPSTASRADSIPRQVDTARNSIESNELNRASTQPAVISLSDDDEEAGRRSQQQHANNNGNGSNLSVPIASKPTTPSHDDTLDNLIIGKNEEAQTPHGDAFNRSFRFLSADNDNPEQEIRSQDKSTRASSLPQQTDTDPTNQVPTTSTANQGSKSEERPAANESTEGAVNPPIKIKFRLPERKLPVIDAQTKAIDGDAKNDSKDESPTQDGWEDFCFVCNEGCDENSGDLGCCSTCPRVFHRYCHVPYCPRPMEQMPDDWRCGVCLEIEPITEPVEDFPRQALLACSRILLLCYKDSQKVEVFRRAEFSKDYENHINLFKIGARISKGSYRKVPEFICDMNTLFINCSKYNTPSSPIAEYGRLIYRIYQDSVRDLLPAYTRELWMYINLCNKSEVPRKKRKIMD